MKKYRIISVVISTALLAGITCMPAMAAGPLMASEDSWSKTENVYARLSAEGAASDGYIVNAFELDEAAEITDWGNYSEVTNLTDLSSISKNGNKISFSSDSGKFYYQGIVENIQLPWNYTITYYLDGKKTDPSKLGGASGHLRILLDVKQNEKVDEVFFENYVTQISLTFDGKKSSGVSAEDGTIADSGADKMITFTLLPGQEGSFEAEADVKEFAMDGISMAAVPYSMDIDPDDYDLNSMTEQFEELTDAAETLKDAANELAEGMDELGNGGDSLTDGIGQLEKGIHSLNSSSSQITDASASIWEGLTQLSKGLSAMDPTSLSELNELPRTLTRFSEALTAVEEGLEALQDGYADAYCALNQVMEAADDNLVSQEELSVLAQAAASNRTALSAYQKLTASYQTLLAIKGTYDQITPAFDAVLSSLDTEGDASVIPGLKQIIAGLDTMSSGLKESLEGTDMSSALGQLQRGIGALAENYGSFHEGLVSYTDGVAAAEAGVTAYGRGIESYAEGARTAADGTAEYAFGMEEFSDGVSEIPDKMETEIDEMMEQYSSSGFDAVSFTDPANTNVDSVQFVLVAEGISAPEKAVEENQVEKMGFLRKLINLFRKK